MSHHVKVKASHEHTAYVLCVNVRHHLMRELIEGSSIGMPMPGRGDGDLCRAKEGKHWSFHREGSNAGLVDWAHNSVQLLMYQTPVQAVVTCAMRGPCHLGKEIRLNEKDRDRHCTTA